MSTKQQYQNDVEVPYKKTFQKLMVDLHFKGSVEFGQIENVWKAFQEKKV